MYNKQSCLSKLRFFGLVFVCLFLSLSVSPASAQLGVNFDFGGSITTAHVPDIEPPSIPILISPEDLEVVVVSKPTFEWYGSTDNVAVNHYQLWIDSGLYFGYIPTSDQDTAFFTLTYNSGTNTYSLTTKQAMLDGDHTWSVVAADAAGNESTSATWNFTIDTEAPDMAITMIEGGSVLITTTDSGTLPTAPIVTSTSAPLISGTGEPNTTLHIYLAIPGDPIINTTYLIGAGGTWSYQFPTLDDNVLATLTLIIEDDAGHTNVLSPIQFIHNPAPTATPAPSGTTVVTATPTISTTPGAAATASPTPRAGSNPTIFLSALTPTPFPTRPPSEQSPIQPLIQLFNTPKTDFVVSRGRDKITFVSSEKKPLWEWLSFLVLALPAILTAILVMSKFNRWPDAAVLRVLWWLFGFDRHHKPDGEVHDRQSTEGLWLIPLHTTKTQKNETVVATITNRVGDFVLPQLENATYRLEPKWKGLSFPALAKRPESLPWHKFYKGETVTYDTNLPWPYLHIPVERLRKQSPWEARLLDAIEWHGSIVIGQVIIICLIYILSPSIVTGAPVVISLILGFVRYMNVRNHKFANNTLRY